MKLYSFQPSPYGSRVRLALRHKAIEYEIASADEVHAGGALIAAHPMEIPTILVEDGDAVSGSSTILDYLEDAYPSPSLRPKSPKQAALARMLVQVPDTYMQDAPRRLFGMADPNNRNQEAVDQQVDLILSALMFIEQRIDGGPWAVGDNVSIADCALLPVLNAISLLGNMHGRQDVITRHPNLSAYWEAAQLETKNAQLLAEQLAGLPPGLRAFVTVDSSSQVQSAS